MNREELNTKIVETLEYYLDDPKKHRCVGEFNKCQYMPTATSKGCFVGIFIDDEELKRDLDKAHNDNSIPILALEGHRHDPELVELRERLPQVIKDNIPLFSDLQLLHDETLAKGKHMKNGLKLHLASMLRKHQILIPEMFTKYM